MTEIIISLLVLLKLLILSLIWAYKRSEKRRVKMTERLLQKGFDKNINGKLDRIETKIDARMDKIESRVSILETKKEINNE